VARPMRPMYGTYYVTLVRVGPSNETLILTVGTSTLLVTVKVLIS
jgi:hypothetical protein